MLILLAILTLAQASAVPPPPPVGTPAPAAGAPTVQTVVQPTALAPAAPAGLPTWAVLALSAAGLVSGGLGVEVARGYWTGRSERRAIAARGEDWFRAQFDALLKERTADTDAELAGLRSRVEALERDLKAERDLKHDAVNKLHAAVVLATNLRHEVAQRTAERDLCRVRYQALAAEHARCPRPTPKPKPPQD